jgi:small subunit ribosomal protein S16
MPVKIRLQRRGKKGNPFYHVVIADGRAPRDGRFIEKIGTYNPLTHPATITLDVERAFHWVSCGAQPTDTARMILKREGVYLKKHLVGGVQKGALTEEQADAKLIAWKEDKTRKLTEMKLELTNSKKSVMKKRLEAEAKVKEAKATIVNEKRQAVLAAEAARRAEIEAQIQAKADEKAEAQLKAEAEAAIAEIQAETETSTEEAVPEMVSEEVLVSEEAPISETTIVSEETSVSEDTPVSE